jgi:membrane associated rhomboid family serine protease
MIPISDTSHNRYGGPALVTIALIVVNVLVWLYQASLSDRDQTLLVYRFAMVPAELLTGLDVPPTSPWGLPSTMLTSMFMHGGWSHIIGNMAYLWVFGDNIEHTLGKPAYLVFYLACGAAAAVAHLWSDPLSNVPTLGASGAISGVLGAYLLLYPTNGVNCLVIFGFFIRTVTLPAMIVLGFWIVLQLFNGLLAPTIEGGGVAYWAHIGGFAAGMLLAVPIRLLRRPEQQPYRW